MGKTVHLTTYGLAFLSVLSTLLFLLTSCRHATPGGELPLLKWHMSYVQTSDPAQALLSEDWIETPVASLFRPPFSPAKDIRSVWLKSEINLENSRLFYGLSLGRIYMTDRLFVNGILCGEHGQNGIRELHYPRNYILPQGVLKKGPNQILIHVGIYGREFGGLAETPRLLSKKSFDQTLMKGHLLFLQIPLGIMLLYLCMLVLVFLTYEKGVNGKQIAVLMGIISVWVSHLFMIYSPIQPLGMDIRINALWLCSYINSVLFFLFIQLSLRYYFRCLNLWFISFVGLAALVTLVWNDTTASYYPGRILGGLVLAATNGVGLYMLVYLTRCKGISSTRLIWIFGFAPSVTISLDIVNYLYGSHEVPLTHVYAIPLMTLPAILHYRSRFIRNRLKVKWLTDQLNRAGSDSGHDGKKAAMTLQLETKLQSLKEYISQHYTAPLTRDFLAEKMAMNPDYMSRMFKNHEGVKINHYINAFRVNEACRLLETSDSKIIDIAFGVGFESLATFNRAFIKQHRVSPSEYRLKHPPNDRA